MRRALLVAALPLAALLFAHDVIAQAPELSSELVVPFTGKKIPLPQNWAAEGSGPSALVNRLVPPVPMLVFKLGAHEGVTCAAWETAARASDPQDVVPRPDFVPAPWWRTVTDAPTDRGTSEQLEACLDTPRGAIGLSLLHTLTDGSVRDVAPILSAIAVAAGAGGAPAQAASVPPPPTPAEPRHHDAPSGAELLPKIALPSEDHYDPAQIASLRSALQQGLGGGYLDWCAPIAERIVAIEMRALGPDHADTKTDRAMLFRVRLLRGDAAGAAKLAEDAAAAAERRGAAALAEALGEYAATYASVYDYGHARALLVRAESAVEKAAGPEAPETAAALRAIARLDLERGELVAPEPLLSRAVAIVEKRAGASSPELIDPLVDQAALLRARGDLEGAEHILRRALGIANAFPPKDGRRHAPLRALAEVVELRDDMAEANGLYSDAMSVAADAFGAGSPEALSDIGDAMRVYVGGMALAGEWGMRHALEEAKRRYGDRHPLVAKALVAYSFTQQDPASAERLLEQALAMREETLGKQSPDVAATLTLLANLAEDAGANARALELRARAGEIREKNLALVLAAGSESQKRLYTAQLRDETDATISLHAQRAPSDPAAMRLAALTVLRRKGRVLDAMADVMGALRRGHDAGLGAELDRLEAVRARLATAVLRGPGALPQAQYTALVQSLTDDAQKLEADLSTKSAAFRAVSAPVTLESVAAAIPEGAALVEIAAYRPFTLGNRRLGTPPSFAAPRYAAYVLRRGGALAYVDLGPVQPIDAAGDAFRAALADEARDANAPARAIDALVMQKIRPLLAGATQVVVSPDGKLNLVPFSAMRDESGRFLLDSLDITYVASGRDLLRFGQRNAAESGPVLVASPDFGVRGAGATGLFAKASFPALPGTKEEATRLAEILPGSKLLTGSSATESSLKELRAPRILHVATHGFFLDDAAERKLHTRGFELESGGPEDTSVLREDNPLLRSGLALAGANRGQSGGGDDGVLTALEASDLDLWGTKLVVLSACETGLGTVASGEGVYGLRRALVMAGAETQVMSLWKVDDDATRDLMVGYYRRLLAGRGRADALRDAQLELRNQPGRAHPKYWAAFIVSGDPSPIGADDAPAGRLAPGEHGCGCRAAGTSAPEDTAFPALAAMAVLGAAARRRARAREA